MTATRIGVVGGGVAGLAAAHRLQAAGVRVTVFEALPRVGGRAITDEVDGWRVDAGAQLFASMYERFLGVVQEMGMGARLRPVEGRDALWRDGHVHEVVYGSVANMAASRALPFATKLRLGARYLPFLARHGGALRLDAPEAAAAAGLDGETIAEWGEREIDDTFVRALAYPQLAAYYGADVRETSAGFYHLLARHGTDVRLFAVAGGVGDVAERLAETIRERGGEVRLDSAIERIELEPDRVRLTGAGGVDDFDAVVGASPAPVTAAALDGALPSLVDWLGAVRYRPSLTLALLLDRPVGVRYFGLSYPRGETRFVSAVTVQENKDPGLVPSGAGLLVAFPTPEAAPALVELESRRIVDSMLPEIERAFPGVGARVTRARVYRWPVGMPIFYPGYLGHLGSFRSGGIEEGSRLALAGDYLYGPSVEGAVTSGFAAADRLLRRFP